jgi:uncharacterized protein YraI
MPASTWTPAPSPTLAPTASPEAPPETPTPAAAPPEIRAQVTANGLNLREAPGSTSAIVGSAEEGDSFLVTGRTQDGAWLRVCCVGEREVWLSAAYVNLTGAAEAAPVVP